jgi:hypothetical protein
LPGLASYVDVDYLDNPEGPAADVILAGMVFVGTKLALSTSCFAAIGVMLIMVWFLVVLAIYRAHKRRIADVA